VELIVHKKMLEAGEKLLDISAECLFGVSSGASGDESGLKPYI